MIGYHMLCKVPSAQTSRCSEAQQTIRVIRISSWQLVPHFSGSPGSWLCSSSLATTPKQFSSHSVLCSHTCRPSLGANTGWGQEESQQISHERLLACPSQPGFHENTLHGSLCEFPLPVGQESHPPSAMVPSTAWPVCQQWELRSAAMYSLGSVSWVSCSFFGLVLILQLWSHDIISLSYFSIVLIKYQD